MSAAELEAAVRRRHSGPFLHRGDDDDEEKGKEELQCDKERTGDQC